MSANSRHNKDFLITLFFLPCESNLGLGPIPGKPPPPSAAVCNDKVNESTGVPATGAAGLLFTARQRSDSGVQSLEKKSYSPPTLDSILAYPPIPNA